MTEVKYECYFKSLNKYNEELCGDVVKTLNSPNSFIAVLSDGLGSGVKANILATLTSEIISTMLKEGVDLTETVDTVTKTLPICKERGIAYSTFTIVQGLPNGNVKITNFDNPDPMIIVDGAIILEKPKQKVFAGKIVKIWELKLEPGDFIGLISDGVMYAGLGEFLNFGWGWENVAEYIQKLLRKYGNPRLVVENVIDVVNNYYNGKCGDDATVVGILVKEKENLIVFTGPPLNKEDDEKIVKKFLSLPGKKVVCGGTTVNIVSRILGKEPEMDISTARPEIPPMGKLEGIDLVTEGVLTMTKTLEYLKTSDFDELKLPSDRNAALELAKLLINADTVHIIMGQSINPFYQNPDLPASISIRKNIVEELARILREHGKEVTIEYC
ncbi:SpoIIE family protein phosphatase [Thermotoga sp. KOL6]|uniref:SpoIIE family protein phosphatase n=1 Tax=Thermotoga sp. KOL6 TaxID=126741 RepID=UPI000C78E5C4|nr:SpoIIE family protein phosphatase [Thermotoga sp. KOL6]PLV60053.1 serine/threonine protein phosphatase [Thermotoga sp. KOL6]